MYPIHYFVSAAEFVKVKSKCKIKKIKLTLLELYKYISLYNPVKKNEIKEMIMGEGDEKYCENDSNWLPTH